VDAPYLDSAYKMVEYDGRPVRKLSSAKVTAPGRKQVFRRTGRTDMIRLAGEQPADDGVPLPETVMRGGRRTDSGPSLDECRQRCAADLRGLPPAVRRKAMPHTVEWKVRLHLFEDDEGTTKARVVLDTGTTALTGHGSAHCHPADANVPEIGDELAAGRAMNDLAQQLLNAAEHDIQDAGASRPRTRQAAGWPL
jgi:nicotinate phosphoribosyltransferase